jgi:hypothetical protein
LETVTLLEFDFRSSDPDNTDLEVWCDAVLVHTYPLTSAWAADTWHSFNLVMSTACNDLEARLVANGADIADVRIDNIGYTFA